MKRFCRITRKGVEKFYPTLTILSEKEGINIDTLKYWINRKNKPYVSKCRLIKVDRIEFEKEVNFSPTGKFSPEFLRFVRTAIEIQITNKLIVQSEFIEDLYEIPEHHFNEMIEDYYSKFM